MTHRLHTRLFTALCALATVAAISARASTPSADTPVFIVVNGAAGEESYGDVFANQMTAWEKAAATAAARAILIGRDSPEDTSDRSLLERALAAEPKEGTAPLWIVLIGHGTFDKRSARFNLRGDDVTAAELAAWIQPFRRPLAIVNTASASAPFLATLSGAGRVIVTATRSGNEQNFARFGTSFVSALNDPNADLDQDGQLSLLEAFLAAAANVAEFYRNEGRLATEHALIDDNGDGLGTPAAWFRGLRAIKKPRDAAALDGPRAHQWILTPDPDAPALPASWIAQRDALEAAIAALRDQKDSMPADEYYEKLDPTLLELARHYETVPASPPTTPKDGR